MKLWRNFETNSNFSASTACIHLRYAKIKFNVVFVDGVYHFKVKTTRTGLKRLDYEVNGWMGEAIFS